MAGAFPPYGGAASSQSSTAFAMTSFVSRSGRSLALLALIAMFSACSPHQMIVRGVADELASQSQADEDDLELAREASAFYLKLSASLLAGSGK